MVAPTEYTNARTDLIAEVAKYTKYTRTYITPLSSITGLVVDGVVTGFDADAANHEGTSPTSDEDYAFYTPQTEKLIKLKNNVIGSLIYEIELDLLENTDLLYFSGVPDPITQDVSSFTIQSFEMSKTAPAASELSLETTNIPATYASAVNIAKYNTPKTYFTTDERSLTISAGVWKTDLDIIKGSESDYPLFYTQLVEVDQDGNDLSPPVVIATGTENLAISIKKSGDFYHYLNVPEHTVSSALNRLQLKFYTYSSANTTSFTYKIKGVGLSHVHTTVPTPYVDPLRGPAGPTGPSGVSGGLILYMDSPSVTQSVGSITATNPSNQQVLKDPTLTATTTITTSNITVTPVNIATYMTSSSFFTELNVPGGLWSFELNGHSPNNDKLKYYINVKEYKSDGTTLFDTLVTGSSDHAVIVGSQNIYVYQIYISPYILESLNSRLAIEIWALTESGSGTLVIDHRNSTLTNVITTLSQFEGPTGPTGATGPTGPQGPPGSEFPVDKTTNTSVHKATYSDYTFTRAAYVSGTSQYYSQMVFNDALKGYADMQFKLPLGQSTPDHFTGLIESSYSPAAADATQFSNMFAVGKYFENYRVRDPNGFHNLSVPINVNDIVSINYTGKIVKYFVNGEEIFRTYTTAGKNFNGKTEVYLKIGDAQLEVFTNFKFGRTSIHGSVGPAISPYPGILNMAYDHPAGTYSHKKLSADWQTIDQLFLLFTPTQTAVECELTFFISDSSNGAHVNVALSGHASEYQFNEWTKEYPTTTTTTTDFLVEQQPYYMRETTTVRWILKGLTPGTQYRATPALKCPNSPSIYPDLRWGGDSTLSYFYRLPPLVFKIKEIDDSWGTGGGTGVLPGGSGA